jgi:N-acetylneuraminic acid mutarotase
MKYMGFLLMNLILTSALAQNFPDYSQMAYLKQVENKREVAVRSFDPATQTFNEVIISDAKEETYHPDMSPLGNQVAYSRGQIIPGKIVDIEIVIQDLSQKLIEVWTPRGDQYIHVEFSGNARYLVFSGPNPKTKKQNIGIIDLFKERKKSPIKTYRQKDKEVRVYTPNIEYIDSAYDCYAPAVSSQGDMIIYHRTKDNSTKLSPKELIRYDVHTKTKKLITPENGHAMFPSLSADDRYVTYASRQAGQWDIHLFDLWLEENKQITFDKEIEYTPVFAPDDTIYFTRFEEDLDQNNFEIGIFHLSKKDIFNPSRNSRPTAFINEKNISEYVPSFSGISSLQTAGLPSFPKPERSSFGAIEYKGKVYIMGGHQGPEHTYPEESFLKRMDIYDSKTQKWTQGPDMNQPKHGFQMVAHENYIYVFGGFAFSADHKPGWKSLNTIERYDIKAKKWEILKTKLPRARSSNVSVKVGGLVYLIGGWDSTPKHDQDYEGRFHSEIDVFNLKDLTVHTLKTKLSPPLRRAFNATVYNDEIYLMGGISQGANHFDWIDLVTKFSPKTEDFSEVAKLPYATFAPGVGALGDKLYLIGGMVLKNPKTYDLDYVDDIYEFDLKTKKWTHIGKFLKENKGFPQIVNIDPQTIGILGGHTYVQDSNGEIIDHPVASFETLKVK